MSPYRDIGSFGKFIRKFLLKRGKSYPWEMWKAYNRWLRLNFYRPIRYSSFVRYIKLLEDLGLIICVGEENPKPIGGRIVTRRKYYVLNEKMLDSKIWENPFKLGKKKKERKQKTR